MINIETDRDDKKTIRYPACPCRLQVTYRVNLPANNRAEQCPNRYPHTGTGGIHGRGGGGWGQDVPTHQLYFWGVEPKLIMGGVYWLHFST